MTQHIAKVILPIPVDEAYSYQIPEDFRDLIQPGVLVIVPLGNRFSEGVVFAVEPQSKADAARELREIEDVVDTNLFVGEDLLKLISWISEYYISYLGEALRLLNPGLGFLKSQFLIQRLSTATPQKLSDARQEVWDLLPINDWIDIESIEKQLSKKNLLHCAHFFRKNGWIETKIQPPVQRKIYKTEDVLHLNELENWSDTARKKYVSTNKRQKKTLSLIDFLKVKKSAEKSELRNIGYNSAILKRLLEENVLKKTEKQVLRDQDQQFVESRKNITLTPEQQAFVDLVAPNLKPPPIFKAFLLHGITGSGKTQIYIELIRRALFHEKEAIVLIPEIVLTPQTTARFRNYFGSKVGVIHSRIPPAEKLEVLQKCREGKISVVVGPRSAIFAPFKNLGVIIVDEEHETSYKASESSPRYNARDVALYRAHLNNIPIVLGSATPSIESLYNAKTEKYVYYHLDQRISHRQLPRTQLVDIKVQWRKGNELPLFSENLLLKLEARILCREQAMLLQNRRGYSPYLLCQECGHIEQCPNCDITLTYHLKGRDIRCHYCGYSQPAHDLCPQCKGVEIIYKGIGTQKIEEELQARFPYAKTIRMDQDTTRKKHDHAKMLTQFREHKADFLLGTKMIAKGLDFEKVTLVGIINADHGLNFPDFRASEKTFQLLVQASGRSGRGTNSGEVLIQTFDPSHYIFKFLMTHDYLAFYEKEITSRKMLSYPPFSRLCLVRLIGDDETAVLHYAKEIVSYLWKCNTENKFRVLGPAPAPIAKINNQYRYQILIKQPRETDPSMKYLRSVLKNGIYKNGEVKKWPLKVQIDIDPLDIL